MRNTGEGAKPPLRYSLNLSAHFRVWVTVWVRQLTHILTHTFFKLYPRKWTRDFDPWPRSADTHLTHRGRSAAPVLHQFEVHPAGGEQRTAAVHVPQRELLGQRAPRELLRAHEGRAGQ